MAKTDWNDEIRNGVDAIRADELRRCEAGDLKGLLNSIVDQLADADRRHSDTLHQMQDRLATMGRDASVIRTRVPDQFAPAFGRIEAGMAELATRISEQSNGVVMSVATAAPSDVTMAVVEAISPASSNANLSMAHLAAAYPAVPAKYDAADGPKALRSADDGFVAAPRQALNDDTFDVIETSLPGDVSNPWQSDSADALADLYDVGPSNYSPTDHPVPSFVASALPSLSGSATGSSLATAVSTIDATWLETRFADISRRIDETIADIRPEQSFFALGQRLDSVEQHVSKILETSATRADVDGIRLIETHIDEIANHLDHTNGQLARLETIEGQLFEISQRLGDIQTAALEPQSAVSTQAPFDVHAVARAAVEQATSRFADIMPAAQAIADDGVRNLLEGFISESRQGEEVTNALLDTLQQAMIRLLDRVDAMEITQHRTLQAHSSPKDYAREQVSFNVEPQRHDDFNDSLPNTALDAAVAAVASAKSMSQATANTAVEPPATAASSVRSPDKMRQDFIADARRAKQRLADQLVDGDGVVSRPMSATDAASDAPTAMGKPVPPGKAGARGKVPPSKASQPTSAARLMVMAVGAMTVVGGLWYALDAGKSRTRAAPSLATSAPAKATPAAKASTTSPALDAGQGEPVEMKIPEGTRGEIIPGDITVGQTSVPLHGIAVDSEAPPLPGEVERANRRHSMAAMSSRLGQAAATLNNGIATPASLVPANNEGALLAPLQGANGRSVDDGPANDEAQSVDQRSANPSAATFPNTLKSALTGGVSQNAPLDLPPASVGPLSLRLAAANGDPSAEFDVGARLAEGKGTTPNYKEAAKWYQRSADRGFAQAQYRLGTLYERGLGLKADPSQARAWYERAAELGNTKAMHNLAVLSANQVGGSPDYPTASHWFTEASERGLSDSQFNLAVLYENGLGVATDLAQSFKWLSLAARGGDAEAIRRRDILKGKLTADDIAKADALIRTWKAKPTDALINDARTASDAWKKNPQNGVSG